MIIENRLIKNPFFSICIPQYNRTSFLIEACKVLASQTFKDFEVCISDDKSNDGRQEQLIDYLKSSSLSFIYQRQEINLRYDGNIRASIALARGKYCFLHGNDDCLASENILQELYAEIFKNESLGVIIPNFQDWTTGEVTHRIRKTQTYPAGVETAATHFRNVAFVTGVMLDRIKSQQFTTNKWDGSEMYQMYLMAKIIASGSELLELEMSAVRKDIQIKGESVDSYAKIERLTPCPIVERKLPMGLIGQVVSDAIAPYLKQSNYNKVITSIFLQLYLFTYPFWIVEYKRVQSWNYALGICLGIHPKNTFKDIELKLSSKLRLHLIYLLVCSIGLIIPVNFFAKLSPIFFRLSKSSKSFLSSYM